MGLVVLIRNAFRHWTDVFHGALGFIACIVNLIGGGWKISLFIIACFLYYQSFDVESPFKSACDILEFICGFMVAFPLFWALS